MEFSEDFFQREIRCGFEISEIMKRAWAAEMEVLQTVIDICERNDLQYFADGGTLLGAVRHQGFIPWDDDIDICLKRNDYMKLVKLLPRELPPGFGMTGMYAETERMRRAGWYPYIRVIADELYWDYIDYMKRFHGFPYPRIGIDIFPIDSLPNDEYEREIIKEMVAFSCYTLENWKRIEMNGELEQRLQYIEKLCAVNIPREGDTANFIWRLVDSVSSLYHEDETDELTDIYYWLERPSYPVKKECYSSAVYLPFEQMKIAAPCGYHEVLMAEYGDYQTYDRSNICHNYPFYGPMEDDLLKQIRAIGFEGTMEEFCQNVLSGELHI